MIIISTVVWYKRIITSSVVWDKRIITSSVLWDKRIIISSAVWDKRIITLLYTTVGQIPRNSTAIVTWVRIPISCQDFNKKYTVRRYVYLSFTITVFQCRQE